MKKTYKNDRVRSLSEITARHENREIEGCTSWRHFAVHQDRAWLLNALSKVRTQVEKLRKAESRTKTEGPVGAEIQKLLGLFEKETLNHLGDKDK
jgi:hypothetical protein